jgi:DNA polymerase III alpha subunit
MQGMLRDARPTRLEDLIALNALYRPGPMDLIPSFVARKHGREEVQYPHPLVEPVLSETYGIMVYQEQVMQTAQVLGGYSLGGADLLRRAMGKKKAEEMAEHRQIFRKGAAEKGIDEKKADEVFDLMEKFAGYGFNKSHAAAYSLLAYHTAWLKVHYSAEFFCANMTVERDNTDKLQVLYADALRMGFITRIVSLTNFDAEIDAYCALVAENAPLTLAAAKRAIREVNTDPAERDLKTLSGMIAACFASADYKEGRTAFMEKRTPQFKGH